MTIRKFPLALGASALAAICSMLPLVALAQDHSHDAVGAESKVLLKTTVTAFDKPVTLPKTDKPEITSMLVTIQPSGHSNLHQHPVPVIAYVLEGAVEVRSDGVSRKYKAGDALIEPMNSPMQAINPGDTPTKLLVVMVGDEGKPNSIAAK